MASRDSSRTSTVLSKRTSKVIMNKSQLITTLSSLDNAEALSRKTEAIEEARRKRAELAASNQTTKIPPSQGVSYASTLGGKLDKSTVGIVSNISRPLEAQNNPLKRGIWPVPTSNTEYQKLLRPQALVSGVSAICGLQISGRSALGSISGNVPPQVALSQGSVVANGDRPTDKVHRLRDFQVGAVFSAATHQWDYSETLTPGNANQSITRLGIVHSKFRNFLILVRFATHVLALYDCSLSLDNEPLLIIHRPIYTHEGRGLFVSIRDVDQMEQAAIGESTHDVIWAERYPVYKNPHVTSWFMMFNSTSIHLTAPYSHPMGLKCTISGKLKPNFHRLSSEIVRRGYDFGTFHRELGQADS
jgi:hypothetical protein